MCITASHVKRMAYCRWCASQCAHLITDVRSIAVVEIVRGSSSGRYLTDAFWQELRRAKELAYAETVISANAIWSRASAVAGSVSGAETCAVRALIQAAGTSPDERNKIREMFNSKRIEILGETA